MSSIECRGASSGHGGIVFCLFAALAGSQDPETKEQEQGRARERQHMCTAEVTKPADLSRAGGTRPGERNGREAKCTVRNRKKQNRRGVQHMERGNKAELAQAANN